MFVNFAKSSVLISFKAEYCHGSMYVVFPKLGLPFNQSDWFLLNRQIIKGSCRTFRKSGTITSASLNDYYAKSSDKQLLAKLDI